MAALIVIWLPGRVLAPGEPEGAADPAVTVMIDRGTGKAWVAHVGDSCALLIRKKVKPLD